MTDRETRRLVLVTGTPRSGTTPVGDVLAAARRTRTLYEPLNRHVGDRRVRRYFEVPGTGGFMDATVDGLVDDVRRLRLRLRPGLFPEDRGPRRLAKRLTGSRARMTYRLARLPPRPRTLVWKDPFAAFLAEDVARRHDVPVVVTLRPPEAVAASFKRLGWTFDVHDLLGRLDAHATTRAWLEGLGPADDPVTSATVLWWTVNDMLLRASTRTPGIHLVDVEELVHDPHRTYRRLFATVGLDWGPTVERHLARSLRADGPARPTRDRAHVGHRDPTAVNRYWVDVLDEAEAALVREATEELWARLRQAAIT